MPTKGLEAPRMDVESFGAVGRVQGLGFRAFGFRVSGFGFRD